MGRMRRAVAAAALGLLLGGCASFPDNGPREWHEKIENAGELGGPPAMQDPGDAPPTTAPPSGSSGQRGGGAPQAPTGCVDPDPQVVATCLDPVGAIAVLPDAASALVAERTTGRVLRVKKDTPPTLVATVPVDASGGGGLTGLVLSPGYIEDQLLYAYVSTPTDNRVVRIAPGEPAKPVLAGIPRGPRHNAGALAVDSDGSLLVATGDAGGNAADPATLAGKVLRIDTLGRPAKDNPDPRSPIFSSGLSDPGGICKDPATSLGWVTDHGATQDLLYLLRPGTLQAPAWSWPDRPGVAGCVAMPGVVGVAESGGAALYVLRPDNLGVFTGNPETLLLNTYGRLSAAASAPDGLIWLGTVNKAGGKPVASDDRAIRIQPPSGAQSKS